MDRVNFFDAARLHELYGDEIRAAIARVLASGRFILGPFVAEFERAFAQWCGVGSAIGVANGSDALELALRALGVGPGDRVITVANAGGYSTTAILACGALPTYVEVDANTQTMSTFGLGEAVARKPKALIATHLYGRLADIESIVQIAAQSDVPVIEDCAQAHGARRAGGLAGSFGAMGCFSFYPTKNLGALGDGGAIITSDVELASSLRALRQYGWKRKYLVEHFGGRNSRLDEIQAAILLAKLPGLARDNQRRCAIAEQYNRMIENPAIQVAESHGGNVYHLYVIRCSRRTELRSHLSACGIDSEIHYPNPDHLQPAWRSLFEKRLPITETLAQEVLSLPCHPVMTDEEVIRVASVVNAFH